MERYGSPWSVGESGDPPPPGPGKKLWAALPHPAILWPEYALIVMKIPSRFSSFFLFFSLKAREKSDVSGARAETASRDSKCEFSITSCKCDPREAEGKRSN